MFFTNGTPYIPFRNAQKVLKRLTGSDKARLESDNTRVRTWQSTLPRSHVIPKLSASNGSILMFDRIRNPDSYVDRQFELPP